MVLFTPTNSIGKHQDYNKLNNKLVFYKSKYIVNSEPP